MIVPNEIAAALAGELFVVGAMASGKSLTTNERGLEIPNRPITRA